MRTGDDRGGPRADALVVDQATEQPRGEDDAGAEHDTRDAHRRIRAPEQDADLRDPDRTARAIQPGLAITAGDDPECRFVVAEGWPRQDADDRDGEPRDHRGGKHLALER